MGWGHRAIFYGFVLLFVGTVVLGFDTDFLTPVFGISYFHGRFYLAYKEALNLAGTVLIAGLVIMMVRRGIRRPSKRAHARADDLGHSPASTSYQLGDWMFVVILLTIAASGFLLEGVRIAMSHPGYASTQWGGWICAQLLAGLSHSTLATVRHGLWWAHGVVALAFVASIPFTRASHMLTSYLSVSFRRDDAKRRLEPIPPALADQSAGYGALSDFSPLHLLQLDACTKCGRCHEVCPANTTGLPLSPRDLVLDLRDRSSLATGGVLQPDLVGDGGLQPDTVWACMQCNACVEICPVGIEHAPIINQLRRRLVENADLDASLSSTLVTIHKTGNSFGESRRKRGRWTDLLDFEVKDARDGPVDVLWFVGDYASFDARSQEISRTLARLLHLAGVDFGLLFDGEANAGNDVRRVGEEGLFESLADQNIAAISACSFNRIMTSDPHSLNTLRNEYPEFGKTWTVVHHTQLLRELLELRRLSLRTKLSYRVTYHDPCHLGRLNGEYENPRAILSILGCTIVEMPRNRDNSFCCGAGGGRIWVQETPGTERPSENRIREAIALDEVEFFVVACPKDVAMYEDAIKTSGNSDSIALREVTQLVAEAVLTPP